MMEFNFKGKITPNQPVVNCILEFGNANQIKHSIAKQNRLEIFL